MLFPKVMLAVLPLLSTAGLAAEPPESSKNQTEQETERAGQQSVADILRSHGTRDPRVHDPSSIVKCDDEYWFFSTGTGLRSWRSKDLKEWERGPRVFPEIPSWVTRDIPGQRGHFWAPDIVRLKDRYLLYYSVSRFGRNTSAIALVSNRSLNPVNPNYLWKDEGIVIRSHRTNDFNTIDPAVIHTPDGDLWMSFGSFWSGIKLVKLDPATGLRISPDSPIHSLAYHREIEAPHIHHRGNYYYLFVNWGLCCRGTNSTYNVRVGRSQSIVGPYLDKRGKNLLQGGGALLLQSDGPFIGPGHASIFRENGRDWFSCHFYDGTNRGRSRLALRLMSWDAKGWPILLRDSSSR